MGRVRGRTTWEVNEGAMEPIGILYSSEKTMAIQRDGCWPQATETEREKICGRKVSA